MPDRHELLILDTGPIRELVLFHAVERFGFERLRTRLKIIASLKSYTVCSEFIGSFRRKTTSAAVVAELNSWIRETQEAGRARLWGRVSEEFRVMGMDEEVVRLVEMDINLVAWLGPVDVSLLELARRHNKEEPVVLTLDRSLHGQCWQAGLRARFLQEVSR